MLLAPALLAQAPRLIELNKGESERFGSRTIRLIDVRERTEPYFEPTDGGRILQAVTAADVTVEVDDVRRTFTGGPCRLPVEVNGVSLLLGVTRGWSGGIAPDRLDKDVRLEVRPAGIPWYEPERFRFPIRDYRWRVMNYQHTYLALAVNQSRLYYHRGEDFGMIPDVEQALALAASTVLQVPGPRGDGASNSIFLQGWGDLFFRYAHMNTPRILPDVTRGARLVPGQVMGLTGNTWRGGPVSDPHLHIEARAGGPEGSFVNSFPLIVAAYRRSYPEESLPVAGGWRHVFAGDTVELDGSLSIAANMRTIKRSEWTFTDGMRATGAIVARRYPTAGTYSERLTITDDHGQQFSDLVEVFVLSREQKHMPPYAWINYYPVRRVRRGTNVIFVTRFARMKDVRIDFGDGTDPVAWEETVSHVYRKAGTYFVRVTGDDSGSGAGVFQVRVVVN